MTVSTVTVEILQFTLCHVAGVCTSSWSTRLPMRGLMRDGSPCSSHRSYSWRDRSVKSKCSNTSDSIEWVFSSPEHKVLKVSFCDGPLSVVHRPCIRASTISLNNISSETTYWILNKLHRNDPCVVPYQSCSNRSSWLHK